MTGARPVLLAAALIVVVGGVASCPRSPPPAQERTLFFRGEPVAHIQERVVDLGDARQVTRTSRLLSGEEVVLEAVVDVRGIVREARYKRGNVREVRLVGGRLHDVLTGTSRELGNPAVALELLRFAQPPRPIDVTLVDFASGETLLGRLERQGAAVVATDTLGAVVARVNVEGLRSGPGAFFEGDTPPGLDNAPVEVPFTAPLSKQGRLAVRLVGVDDVIPAMQLEGAGQRRDGAIVLDSTHMPDDPPLAKDIQPSLFVESEHPAVLEFARRYATDGTAIGDATALVTAIHPLVDARKTDEPPSAVGMLAHGGDCDGAAALLVASLRASRHHARAVVGYRRAVEKSGDGKDTGRFVPHAWVEVYTPDGWMLVDATVPRVGADGTHLKLFEGLGSALTMGRVLGRLRLEPAP